MKCLRFLVPMFLLGASLFAQNIFLDKAVQSSVEKIEARLPQGAKVAILVFNTPSQALSGYIIDELVEAISTSGKLKVIERQYIDAIRKEMTIQLSGDVSDDEAKRIGRQLGAQFIVTGILVDIGGAYRFRVAAIDVESAVREASSSLNIDKTDPQIVYLMPNQGNIQPPAVTQDLQPTATTPVTQTAAISYQIGSDDTVSAMNRTLRDDGEDIFLLVPNSSGRIIVETTGNVDTYIEFYDAETNILLAEDDDSGLGYNARIRYDVQSGRRYIVKVTGVNDSGNYGFRTYRERIYQIGERGPAGGIIFYDKVTFSDGWRYLEAAPADTEIANARWGTFGHNVSGTEMDLGSGKINTYIVNNYLRSINESGRAAQLCVQLNSGGFFDWFLPSMEELNWMYLNLHAKGLGGFKNVRYWSSSQFNSKDAWYRNFGDKGRASHDKDKDGDGWVFRYDIAVRAIRSF